MRSPRTAVKSSPRSLQLEKARAQQQRPNAAKNKINKFIKKKKSKWILGYVKLQGAGRRSSREGSEYFLLYFNRLSPQ